MASQQLGKNSRGSFESLKKLWDLHWKSSLPRVASQQLKEIDHPLKGIVLTVKVILATLDLRVVTMLYPLGCYWFQTLFDTRLCDLHSLA